MSHSTHKMICFLEECEGNILFLWEFFDLQCSQNTVLMRQKGII